MKAYKPLREMTPDERRGRKLARGRRTAEVRKWYMARGIADCEACGWRTPVTDPQQPGAFAGLHLHHVVAVSAGGSDHRDNLVLLCGACHAVVHAMRGRSDDSLTRVGLVGWLRRVLAPKEPGPDEMNQTLKRRFRGLEDSLGAIWSVCARRSDGVAIETVATVKRMAGEALDQWGIR